MEVLANRYLFKFKDMMPESVKVDLFDPGNLPGDVHSYDALFVNTTTPLNSDTLPEPGNIQFVATGSSGTDHMDEAYLMSQNITTGHARGCNATSVAEYVLTSVLVYLDSRNLPLNALTAGIVGAGAVGSEVSRLFSLAEIPHILYDPPRQERDSDFISATMKQLFSCDILTFHTPLTTTGKHPTHHLLNASWFENTTYELILNTARGGVVDEATVLNRLEENHLDEFIADVWENEPLFSPQTAHQAFFSTPHIAGYSVQSKRRATEMIINQFCDHFGITSPEPKTESPVKKDLSGKYQKISQLLLEIHPIPFFDRKMRDLADLNESERGKLFAKLRSETPLRHEFSNLMLDERYLKRFSLLQKLGIKAS